MPKSHPLRAILEIAIEALAALENDFASMYVAPFGPPVDSARETSAVTAVTDLLYDPLGTATDETAGVPSAVPLVCRVGDR